jgi:hypothetical protein
MLLQLKIPEGVVRQERSMGHDRIAQGHEEEEMDNMPLGILIQISSKYLRPINCPVFCESLRKSLSLCCRWLYSVCIYVGLRASEQQGIAAPLAPHLLHVRTSVLVGTGEEKTK